MKCKWQDRNGRLNFGVEADLFGLNSIASVLNLLVLVFLISQKRLKNLEFESSYSVQLSNIDISFI